VAKRKRVINERIIKKRQKEGRGQGRGANYQPWLRIQDVPSQGLSTRIKGWKTGRCHHFLSKLECQYFYILEWSPIVSDVREQYPLELSETLEIAERLGIKHPTDPRTQQPIVMTTDFVNTVDRQGKLIDQARAIKYSRDLSSDRTLEKLEIERVYWTERETDWGIVTEHEMEPVLAANVSWVHAYGAATALSPLTDKIIRRVETVLTLRVNKQQAPLPEGLLADRGEFEGYQADHLVNALNVRVSNTPPYRADWKGIIERQFRVANEKVIHFTPGAVNHPRVHGGADCRLDASLTLNEFRRLLICYALDHNQNQYLGWYRKDEWQIADGVERYPLELWNWGLRNRAGRLRALPRDLVRFHLLPRKSAMVTYRGIHFGRGLYYNCDLAQRESWFARARDRGAWKVEVSYDPRDIETIYLRLTDSPQLEPCRLLDVSRPFRGRDWHEVTDHFALEKRLAAAARGRSQQTQAMLNAQQNQIISEAQEMTDAAREAAGYRSKRSRIGGILDNRSEEQRQERERQAWRLDASPEETGTDAPQETDEETYVPPASHADTLRKLRQRQWEPKQE
jgi:TnsA endonuclease N terminal/Mu transposase, C-terminal